MGGAEASRSECGAMLLEAIVALTVLSLAGAGALALAAAALRAERDMAGREAVNLAADRVLAASALLTRTDLDRRLGRRSVGEFTVEVQRPEPALYRIAIAESRSPDIELLVTVIYRPEAQ